MAASRSRTSSATGTSRLARTFRPQAPETWHLDYQQGMGPEVDHRSDHLGAPGLAPHVPHVIGNAYQIHVLGPWNRKLAGMWETGAGRHDCLPCLRQEVPTLELGYGSSGMKGHRLPPGALKLLLLINEEHSRKRIDSAGCAINIREGSRNGDKGH